MDPQVQAYLNTVPQRFSEPIKRLRTTILENLPDGYHEEISYKMIGYVVPLATFPAGYLFKGEHALPLMNLGYQKHHIALYHYGIYADVSLREWFIGEYQEYGYPHVCDYGKSCIRFKVMDEIPYELIGKLSCKISVTAWIRLYEESTNKKKRQ